MSKRLRTDDSDSVFSLRPADVQRGNAVANISTVTGDGRRIKHIAARYAGPAPAEGRAPVIDDAALPWIPNPPEQDFDDQSQADGSLQADDLSAADTQKKGQKTFVTLVRSFISFCLHCFLTYLL